MTNYEKYVKVFKDCFGVNEKDVVKLEYQGIETWDSVGHIALITYLEDVFNIEMDTDDVIDFSSFKTGIEILNKNYNIVL